MITKPSLSVIPNTARCDEATSAPSVDAVIQSKLGQKLRESYQQVVNEAVPPRFLELLEQLKKKDPPPAEDGS